MGKKNLRERLLTGKPMVADGGMATSLYDKGFYINRSFEELCLTEPQVVKEVTRQFKSAGSELLCTNTFNALEPKLTKHGIQDRLEKILVAAVAIAKEVAEDEAYVMGSIGPLGLVLEPLGPTGHDTAYQYFKRNAQIFENENVDGFAFSGFHDLSELVIGVEAVRSVSDKPIFAHIGIQEDLKTSYGHRLQSFVKRMEKLDVDVIGLSGEVGPSGMLTALEALRPMTQLPICLLPNAGMPRYVNDQYIYLCNPDYIGKFAKRYIQAGANIVGGHSGVGDQHIQAITNAIRMAGSGDSQAFQVSEVIRSATDDPVSEIPLSERSKLGEALAVGKRIFSVELVPPKGVEFSRFLEHCEQLSKGGVEFVNIPDGARAVARMSSLALSAYIRQKFNIEPIPHLTTRDRNLIGLQSDLLGSSANGVNNVLVVTGDPPKLGNCPGATAVFDVDAIGLTHIVNRMNQGLDLGGSSFGQPTRFVKGVALNPTTPNRKLEIERFKFKIEAGADFVITQPIYCMDAYRDFFDEVGSVDIPIIMGIWPLVSLRNAEFLNNELPGVVVPEFALNEMKKADGDKEESVKRGVEIAFKTMENANDIVSGFQVSAPFNRVSVALEVINAFSD